MKGKRKSVYVSEEMIEEAKCQERRVSWLIQVAWEIARDRIRAMRPLKDESAHRREP